MKQEYKENIYSIAWFKIAECVVRGEKERALGVYRLLSHSLDDPALSAQLEADILLACGDDRALASYIKAAEQYEKENRRAQAIAVYEHIMTMQPKNELACAVLVRLYTQEKNQERINEHAHHLMNIYMDTQKYQSAQAFIESLSSTFNKEKIIELCQIVLRSAWHKDADYETVCMHIITYALYHTKDAVQLRQQFLNDLQNNNNVWYNKALVIAKELDKGTEV